MNHIKLFKRLKVCLLIFCLLVVEKFFADAQTPNQKQINLQTEDLIYSQKEGPTRSSQINQGVYESKNHQIIDYILSAKEVNYFSFRKNFFLNLDAYSRLSASGAEKKNLRLQKNPHDSMEDISDWFYTPEQGDTKGSIAVVAQGRLPGRKCMQINYRFAGKEGDYFSFKKNINWDLSECQTLSFWMKGSGNNKHKLIVWLTDSQGKNIGYGPCSLEEKSWKKFKFIISAPTWTPKGFDYKKIKTIRLFLTEGLPPTSKELEKTIWLGELQTVSKKVNSQQMPERPGQWKVTSINENGNLVSNGKAVFPLGLYSTFGIDKRSAFYMGYDEAPTEKEIRAFLKTVKDAGFNMIQSYSMVFYGNANASNDPACTDFHRKGILRYFDYAKDMGLYVMHAPIYGNLKLPLNPKMKEKVFQKRKEQIRGNINTWKNHPALLVWYLADEPDINWSDDIQKHYDYIKTLDQKHPLLIADCTMSAAAMHRTGADIIAEDMYPIGAWLTDYKVHISEKPDQIRSIKDFQQGRPGWPLTWSVIQLYKVDKKGARFPTEKEIRAMSFLALTEDVKGLLFFTANFPDGTRPYWERFPDYWANVKRAIRSIHSVFPAMFSTEVVTGYQVSDPRIKHLLKKVSPGTYFLLSVNPTTSDKIPFEDHPVAIGKVTFSNLPLDGEEFEAWALDESQNGKLCNESKRKIKIKKTGMGAFHFSDDFGEMATHAYKIIKIK